MFCKSQITDEGRLPKVTFYYSMGIHTDVVCSWENYLRFTFKSIYKEDVWKRILRSLTYNVNTKIYYKIFNLL